MKLHVALIVAGLAVLGGIASAHDIGVTRAELAELDYSGRYQLVARIGIGAASLHPPPVLPERCRFGDSPRGVQSPSTRLWELECAGRLNARDALVLPWLRDGVMMTAKWADGTSGQRLFGSENGVVTIRLSELHAGSGSLTDAAGRYAVLGVEHILEGVDHLLFVLGLLLIVSGPVMLIKTITAFTLAHSLTLGLATLGFVNFPGAPVEAAIALSIVFLAMEVVRGWRGQKSLTHRQPWLVAFGFGLLHGFGFAGALAEVGLSPSEIPIALLFFNLGVEVGQLLFVAVVLAARGVLMRMPLAWPSWAGCVPVYLIGTTGAFWVIERVGGMIGSA